MYQIENFELSAARVVAFQLKAGCVIRVTAGRLWLTVQGQPDDIWLQAGQTWRLSVNGTLWLSAEPAAAFQVAQAIAATPSSRWTGRALRSGRKWLARQLDASTISIKNGSSPRSA